MKAWLIGIFCLLAVSVWSQCDDDDLPSGALTVSGEGCGPVVFTLTFALDADDDDDDDDDDDLFTVVYSINGQNFTLSGVKDGHQVEHSLSQSGTALLRTITFAGCTATLNQAVPLEVFASPTLNVTPTAPGCGQSNGRLTAAGSGGAAPYQYQLNGGTLQSSGVFNNLSGGSYTITVRDANGCETTETATLTAPNAPRLNVTPTAPGCGQSNGRLTAAGSGGAAPYQYQLNGGTLQSSGVFNNLGGGSYTITVRDANGCETTETATLAAPNAPVATGSQLRPANCGQSNGAITVNVMGGMMPYRLALNGGVGQTSTTFENLSAGNYRISIVDAAQCTTELTVTVAASGPVGGAAQISSATISSGCIGEALLIEANLPPGTTGLWSSSDADLTIQDPRRNRTALRATKPGEYTLTWTLSANGCSNYSAASAKVRIRSQPQAVNLRGDATVTQPRVDLFPPTDTLTWRVLKDGRKGRVGRGSNNEMQYTPQPGQSGLDTVWYQLCDVDCPLACDSAWVVWQLKDDETPICDLDKIDPRAVFPEGITPNNDGFNDALVFRIIDRLGCPSNYAASDINIFNRWGDRVFIQEPYENAWSGTSRDGADLPPGVYYYVLRIRPEGKDPFVKFGSVTIFR